MSDTAQTVRSLIMEVVLADGTRVSNQALLADLRERVPEIGEPEYHAVKNELVSQCCLAKRPGRGGSVYRPDGEAMKAAPAASTSDKPRAASSG